MSDNLFWFSLGGLCALNITMISHWIADARQAKRARETRWFSMPAAPASGGPDEPPVGEG